MRKIIFVLAIIAAVSARAEQKNVQLLTNLSDAQLGLVMDNMAASLGVHCDFCHVHNEQTHAWDFASDDKQEKKTGREMIRLVLDVNEKNFHGQPRVGCYTCHLGKEHPSSMVALPLPVIPPTKPDHDEAADSKTFPSAKDLVAKYLTALGGDAAAKKITTSSMTAKGTRVGANGQAIPVEVYRSGGNVLVRSTPAEGPAMSQMYGTEGGWMVGRQGSRTLSAADAAQGLAAARAYDPVIPPLPDNARVFGKATIDGHEAWTVGASLPDQSRERIWFDATTGLVIRRLVTVTSPVGQIPTQTDYDDYRDVAGVKVPFSVRVSSVNGGATRKYTSIDLGAPVDAKFFAAPPPTPPPPPAPK
jgi:hypothetical protein